MRNGMSPINPPTGGFLERTPRLIPSLFSEHQQLKAFCKENPQEARNLTHRRAPRSLKPTYPASVSRLARKGPTLHRSTYSARELKMPRQAPTSPAAGTRTAKSRRSPGRDFAARLGRRHRHHWVVANTETEQKHTKLVTMVNVETRTFVSIYGKSTHSKVSWVKWISPIHSLTLTAPVVKGKQLQILTLTWRH